MSSKIKKHLKNSLLTLGILCLSFAVSILLQNVLNIRDHIATVFVFAVFLVSLLTDGYLYGIITALLGVLAVNFAFTFPYLAFNFTIPENFLSALIMIVISLMTSALTTKLKLWQEIKAEGEREKMRANLLRAVSHDLRTPLTTIYGSSSAILENYDSLTDGQIKRMVGGISEDSQWLIGMVENLLSITRIDSGSVKLIKSPTVLEELIDHILLKFRKRYPEQCVEISLPDELVIIPMDAMLIEQVIINILENAIHHAEEMTRLELSVTLEGVCAVFKISDDGCGIEKSRLENIFTGYYQKEEDTGDTKRRNAGIGLSVCATIIKAHGGRIYAENRESGGAVFTFTLDVSDHNEIENYEEGFNEQ